MSENKKTFFGRGRRNFFTGLAVVLPVIISIGIALWLFNKAVDVSDILLYPFRFIPGLELSDIWKDATNGNPGSELFWWWEVVVQELRYGEVGDVFLLSGQGSPFAMFNLHLFHNLWGFHHFGGVDLKGCLWG